MTPGRSRALRQPRLITRPHRKPVPRPRAPPCGQPFTAHAAGGYAAQRETPPRESRTRRPFRTASYYVLLSVYLPTPEPPGPVNAQAAPGINLRVKSQTYIRAQLVKQS